MKIKSLLLLQLLLVGFINNTIAQTDLSFKISVSVSNPLDIILFMESLLSISYTKPILDCQ